MINLRAKAIASEVSVSGSKFITADIARFGSDKSVIMVWSGWSCIDIVVLEKKPVTEVADAIQRLKNRYGTSTSQIVCDEDGVGGGVVDILKCKGFQNGSSPIDIGKESGRFVDAFSREINVVKSYVKLIMPTYTDDIDALDVEVEITPFSITDDKDTINNIMTATGGKPILSQLDGIKTLGWSEDAGETQKQILEEAQRDVAEASF